jgi:hypothetical protein
VEIDLPRQDRNEIFPISLSNFRSIGDYYRHNNGLSTNACYGTNRFSGLDRAAIIYGRAPIRTHPTLRGMTLFC